VAAFAVVTVVSVLYNLATAGRDVPARRLYAGPYVRVDGTTLAYRRWGARGSPIILLGGFLEPAWVWHDVAPLLARRHRVYALDLPPFGYSERRGPYTLARWTTLLDGFAAALRLHRPLIVGHSLGAAVAVSYAVAERAHTAGIVLLDGDARPEQAYPTWVPRLLVPPWYTTLYRIATDWTWLVRRVVSNAWGTGRPPFSAAFVEQWQRPFRVEGTAAALRSLAELGVQGVSTETLRRVRVPSIVVWGARDTVDSADSGRAAASLLRSRFVEIPGAGHLSMLEAPRAVARVIERAPSRTAALG
jgi:pimeloyl-ACP methyl ester carboxylesterase